MVILATHVWLHLRISLHRTVNRRKDCEHCTMAFDRARSDKVMATIVAAEEIAEEVLADRQQIVDLDRKRKPDKRGNPVRLHNHIIMQLNQHTCLLYITQKICKLVNVII